MAKFYSVLQRVKVSAGEQEGGCGRGAGLPPGQDVQTRADRDRTGADRDRTGGTGAKRDKTCETSRAGLIKPVIQNKSDLMDK